MFSKTLSVVINDELSAGKIINKHVLSNNGEPVENRLFREVMDNIEDYSMCQQMLGRDLIIESSFIYINDADLDDDETGKKTELAMKIYYLLIIIGKYLSSHGLHHSKIMSHKGGLLDEDFKKMNEMPYVKEILIRLGYKDTGDNLMLDKVKTLLVHRGIMHEKTGSGSYVLSDAGCSFWERVKDKESYFMLDD